MLRRRLTEFLGRPIDNRIAGLTREIKATQAMATRAYEATQRWPEALAEFRQHPEYEQAYDGRPLISVRVATFNLAEILCKRTLPSLIRQTYENWEAIVVGDCCTDDTAGRIAALGDRRIRFLNLPFRGPYPADSRAHWQVAGTFPMNAGLRTAQGRWIAALDHDDEFDEDHLEVLLHEAQRSRAEVVYGRLRAVVVDTGAPLGHDIGAWPPQQGDFSFLASIVHAGLARFEYDINAHLADEPGDWNLARRMWAAGVRFSYLDRQLGTHYVNPRPWHSE